MYQLDIFDKNHESYLYSEIEKLKNSTDRRCRAIFSLLTEIQNELIFLKEKNRQDENVM
jgi:hypothetical protein